MPTGSKDQPDAFTEALMVVVRSKMGATQINIADLARLTDIPRSTLSRIVNAKRMPELGQVRSIAIALEMPMSKLMTAADEVMAGKTPF